METVVETPGYLTLARKLFRQEERNDIVNLLAADPEAGDVMEGTGGFRKLRVAREGGEKRRCSCGLYFPDFSIPGLLDHSFSEEPKSQSFQERTQRTEETG